MTVFDKTTSTTFTKSMLLDSPHEIYRLITTGNEFAESPLAQDFDILKIISSGAPIAFVLARASEPWCETTAAQDIRILQLRDKNGQTLAHLLASLSNCWPGSQAAQNPDVLTLWSKLDGPVAATLVVKCREWIDTPAASDPHILSTVSNGTSIAQLIVSKYHHRYESTIEKLITSGRAFNASGDFKHNPTKDQQLIKKLLLILEDTPEPAIAVKVLGSMYSTFQAIYCGKETPGYIENILKTTLPNLISNIPLSPDVVIKIFESDDTNAVFLDHFKRTKCLNTFADISPVNDESELRSDALPMFY